MVLSDFLVNTKSITVDKVKYVTDQEFRDWLDSVCLAQHTRTANEIFKRMEFYTYDECDPTIIISNKEWQSLKKEILEPTK